MEKKSELGFPLLIIISIFLHMVVFTAVILPDSHDLFNWGKKNRERFSGGRDIIVNINADDKKNITRKTLLSDKWSTAKGHITKSKGDRWLNNSRDFYYRRGSSSSGESAQGTGKRNNKKILLNDNTEVAVFLEKNKLSRSRTGEKGASDKLLIPDKNDITLKNSIFYSSDGRFSFNTAKFKNFRYFKKMKDKIASNWFPPPMANSIFGSYYTPGRLRIMAIPSQHVKVYFTMNRTGDVLDVRLMDSYNNKPLDESCLDAIKISKNFGKVPKDIKGDVVIIPFIFGYYVY